MSSFRKKRKHRIQAAAKPGTLTPPQKRIFLTGCGPASSSNSPGQAEKVCLRSGIGKTLRVDFDAGIIYGVSLMTAGVATPLVGGDFIVDSEMLRQLAGQVNSNAEGISVRFTHPGLETADYVDDLPFHVGVIKNARLDGDRAIGDVHLGTYANFGPNGQLRDWLLHKAAEDPTHIALSATYVRAENQKDQASGMPVGRIGQLISIDFVGQGASNPDGLLRSAKASGVAAKAAMPGQAAGAGKPNQSTNAGKDAGETLGKQSLREGAQTMTQALKDYLVSQGMDASATEEEAWAFFDGLTGDARTEADRIKAESGAQKPSGDYPIPGLPEGETLSGKAGKNGKTAAMAGKSEAQGADAVALAAANERSRNREIYALAKKFHKDDAWADQQVLAGRPISDIRNRLLEDMAAAYQPVAAAHVEGGVDKNLNSLAAGVGDAIMLRAGGKFHQTDSRTGRAVRDADGRIQLRKPHERAREFGSMNFIDMGRRYLAALGADHQEVWTLSRGQMAELLMNPRKLQRRFGSTVALAQGTSDFPFILGDTLGKRLRAAYEETPSTWQIWASRQTAPDFKQIKLLSLSNAPDLEAQLEDEDVRYGTLSEGREVVSLVKYAKGLKLSWQALVNDDLQAFDRAPALQGAAAKRAEDTVSYAILTANAAMADTGALFNTGAVIAGGTGHANMSAGTAAITLANLDAGFTAMGIQQGPLPQGGDLELYPQYLLVPKALEATAKAYAGKEYIIEGGVAVENHYRGTLIAIASARLNRNSTVNWYLVAGQNQIDTVVVVFLEDEQVPVTDSEVDFDSDALKLKVRHSVAAKAADWRGMYLCGA